MTGEKACTLGELAAALADEHPLEWAESWDNVGLLAGDPSAPVSAVLVTLDASPASVLRAIAEGCQALVTHHPPSMAMPGRLAPTERATGAYFAACASGIGIISMHTNLDRSPGGADALPAALGFDILAPLESGLQPVTLIATYVPAEASAAVRDAMSGAGAGRIGRYEGCAFESEGVGHFRARAGATPVAADGVAELRLEMVCAASSAPAVLAAAADAHPYEEPVILATEGSLARGAARLGRVCACADAETVRDVAVRVRQRLSAPVRIWGSPEAPVRRIAVASGSAGSLVPDAVRAAEVLVAGEVRYHDALDAVAAGCAVIEMGHDVSEWPLTGVLAASVRRFAALRVVTETATRAWSTLEELDG